MERRSAAEEEFLGQATKDFPVRNKDEPEISNLYSLSFKRMSTCLRKHACPKCFYFTSKFSK